LEPGQAQAGNGEGPPVDELLQKNAQLQAELEQLAKQFTNYRLAVEQTLDKRWGVDEEESDKGASSSKPGDAHNPQKKDDSAYYFESYASNGAFFFLTLNHHSLGPNPKLK
jgi:protein arginine N-methyltransferase 3